MKQEEIDTRVTKIQDQLLAVARSYSNRLTEPDVNELIFMGVTNTMAELDPELQEQLTVSVSINPVTSYVRLAFHRVH